ncbi:MAG: hypothetical protein HIU82_17990 [Proteobacteria bacterium]|nr:hypothetical protein [Pseudomonadota bacterium]
MGHEPSRGIGDGWWLMARAEGYVARPVAGAGGGTPARRHVRGKRAAGA